MGPGSQRFVDADYVLESCQGGEIQEGRGGVLRCLDPTSGSPVRTARRRHLATITVAKGDLYIAVGSASEATFADAQDDFSSIIRSFVV